MLKDCLVGRRRRVMKLVHDHDVEVRRVDVPDVGSVQALDRGEHVLELRRPLPAHPLLAESGVPERMAERRATLVEDLLAMSDKQQATAAELGPKARVVDRRDYGLPGPGGSDEQVAMVALMTGEHDMIEKRLLEGAELELDGT